MSTLALIHGAWGSGWHWGAVPGELRALGHEVVAPDLPCDEPEATFDDYADVVVDALAGVDGDVVVVGYSLGGHTAPLVAARRPVRRIVYVAALVPFPGVRFAEEARRQMLPDYLAGIEAVDGGTRWVDFDVYRRVGHQDSSDEAYLRERFARSRTQCTAPFARPCSLDAERLGVRPVELPGASHAPMVSRPAELARLLVS